MLGLAVVGLAACWRFAALAALGALDALGAAALAAEAWAASGDEEEEVLVELAELGGELLGLGVRV